MFGIGKYKIWLIKMICKSKLFIFYIIFYLYLTKFKSILLNIDINIIIMYTI